MNLCILKSLSASVKVSFKFTPKYPEELPEIVIEEAENIVDEDTFLQFLEEIVNQILTIKICFRKI